DSTTSQHGYFYNTNTGLYTFLDDPAAQFYDGVEVTQITGISNSGEIAGFYTDAQGLAHSFVATPVPEPSGVALGALGLLATVGFGWLRRRITIN
ncbi:MAG: PEP-CTERM sorting domain-containing protein, partial [Acidobacteriaceae bacterium]|nr:PEP-CTERM sorting domain-containing protein [Acidobacteriaceae bacterium]